MNNVLCREWVSDVVDFGDQGVLDVLLLEVLDTNNHLLMVKTGSVF